MHVALGIRYRGDAFHGWQSQAEEVTLQDTLEAALARFLDTDERPRTVCAGRTDAGVHATAQVVDFETDVVRSEASWVRGVTQFLPPEMSVTWMREVDSDFSSRFSATERTYEYWIDNEPTPNPVTRNLAAWVFRPLDVEAMREASRPLLGEHDFTSFRAAACQAKTPVRTVTEIAFTQAGPMIGIRIRANAFLYHMVRNIVGALVYVGTGRCPVTWVGKVLDAKNRSVAAPTFAPEGLYFADIRYPTHCAFPAACPTPWGHLFNR
ncbi:MAG TPA: tRNA pseudouridine(38-40) synthase TruA [Sutterella sp.]|nr:tRNA pseudouridine(38-40) synthase TruA [Sutterella sp.]